MSEQVNVSSRQFSLEAALMIVDACFPNQVDPSRRILAENLSLWQGGMVDLVPRALELAEEVLSLRQQVESLSAPVTDAEFKEHAYPLHGPDGSGYGGCFAFSRDDVNALIAARKGAA